MKCPIFAPHKEAAIAQLVERFTRNEEVPSSSLGCGSGQRGTAAGEFPLQPFRFPAEPRLHETGLPVIGDEQPGLPHIIGALHGIKYRQAIIQVGTVLRNGKREDAAVPVETPRIIEIEIKKIMAVVALNPFDARSSPGRSYRRRKVPEDSGCKRFHRTRGRAPAFLSHTPPFPAASDNIP